MKKLTFETNIKTTPAKLWEILWGKETYPKWTAAFAPGSNVETDWQTGSRVVFGDGSGSGMLARIERQDAPYFMSFEHLGMIMNGVEDFDSPEVKAWAGAHENYTLKAEGEQTHLLVELDITEEYEQMMADAWPKALQDLQTLAEQPS